MKFLKGCLMVFGGLFALVIGLGVIGTMMESPEERKIAEQKVEQIMKQEEAKQQTKTATKSATKPDTKKEETKTKKLTGPQKNAVRSAKNYLRMKGFSRDGLIQQLSSEFGDGYKVEDATVAVDSLNANWNKHAARSAKNYLNMMGFSCKGLIEQLSSNAGDQYTVEQATYGAQQAGACK